MRRCYKALMLGATTLLLSSCFTTGRDFPSEVDWVRKDDTTQKDVSMLLGRPFAVGNAGGVPTWTYAYFRYQLLGRSYHKELKLYWHPNGVVKTYSFNSSFPRDLARVNQPASTAVAR